jgi:Flp pilus assembly protein TadD
MSTLRIICCEIALLSVLSFTAWPQQAEELYRQGQRSFTTGNLDAAIAAFQQAVKLRPDYAPAWKALGVAYASRGEFDRAESPFRNACERQPPLPDACIYLGRTLYLLNRFPAAISVLRPIVQAEPRNSEGYRLLGLSFEALGQSAEAGAAFLAAVRLTNSAAPNEDPGIDYGVFLTRQGHAGLAIGPLEDVLKRHPDAARGHLELGCTLLSLDRLTEAAAHLERSVALDPQSGRAHLLLGKVYLRLGKPEAAQEHLRQGSRTVK